MRQNNPLYYEYFEYLFNQMLKLEACKRRKKPAEILEELRKNTEEMKLFLVSESQLTKQ